MPDQRPILRIEPGMHTAPIVRIGVDATCTLMVTGSVDKTARLWALPEGGRGSAKELRTLRVPIGDDNEGKIYSVALAPNGKWVAAGGQTHAVYIFDAATGRLLKRIGGLGNVIKHLAFSPDGSRLAATLGAGQGMRMWETGSWTLLAEDRDYGSKPSYGAAFDGANRLYTVSYDGQIRRYDRDGHLEAKCGYARRQRALQRRGASVWGKARHRLQRYHGGRNLRCADIEPALHRRYQRR